VNPQHKNCLNCRAVFNRAKNCSVQRWAERKYCCNQCSREALLDRDAIADRLALKDSDPYLQKLIEVEIDTEAPLFQFLSGRHRLACQTRVSQQQFLLE
jgi:hypothetical protein